MKKQFCNSMAVLAACVGALILLLATASFGQTPVAPYRNARATFTDPNGIPLAGGCVFFYQGGTSTPQNTYTDSTGDTPNSNPVILDSTASANIWLGPWSYKIAAWSTGGTNCASGTLQWTVDNVPGNEFLNGTINGATITGSTIDNTPIGATTPSTGNFTALTQTDPVVDVRTFGTTQTCEPTQTGHPDDTAALNAAIQTSGASIIIPKNGDCVVSGQLVSANAFRLNLNGGTLTLTGRATDTCSNASLTGQIVLDPAGFSPQEIFNGTISSTVETVSGTPSCVVNYSSASDVSGLYLHDLVVAGKDATTNEIGVFAPDILNGGLAVTRVAFSDLAQYVVSATASVNMRLRDDIFEQNNTTAAEVQINNANAFLSEGNFYFVNVNGVGLNLTGSGCASRDDAFTSLSGGGGAVLDCTATEFSNNLVSGGGTGLTSGGSGPGAIAVTGNSFEDNDICFQNQSGSTATVNGNSCTQFSGAEGMIDSNGFSYFASNIFTSSFANPAIVLASGPSTAFNNSISSSATGISCTGAGPYDLPGNQSVAASCLPWIRNLPQTVTTFTPGSGMGTGATASCATAPCTSTQGSAQLVTGTGTPATGTAITMAWTATSRSANCQVQGTNAASAALDAFPSGAPSTTGLVIALSVAPAASTTYTFSYGCQ